MEEKLNENENVNDNKEQQEEQPKGRFYTDEEIEALKQRIGDQRVTQAMKSLEKKQREAKKLQNMSDDERYAYELDQRAQELQEREDKLVLAENRSTCLDILIKKGLDTSLVDFVVSPTAAEMDAKIKTLEKAFKASVKAEVEKRLAGSAPKKNLTADDSLTKKDLLKMSVRDLQIFKNTNPEEYARLMRG